MLNNLINDLLDLAKLESNTFKFSYEYFDLMNTIKNAFNTVRFLADQKEIKLITESIDQTGGQDSQSLQLFHSLYGDPGRYLQILLNFLSNALKFTNQGGSITVRLTLL